MTARLSLEEWQAVRLGLDVATRSVIGSFPPAIAAPWLLTLRALSWWRPIQPFGAGPVRILFALTPRGVRDPCAVLSFKVRPGEALLGALSPDQAGLGFIGRVAAPWTERSALDGIDDNARAEVLYWLHLSRRDLLRQGPKHDGATLTDAGRNLAADCRAIERAARRAAEPRLLALARRLRRRCHHRAVLCRDVRTCSLWRGSRGPAHRIRRAGARGDDAPRGDADRSLVGPGRMSPAAGMIVGLESSAT